MTKYSSNCIKIIGNLNFIGWIGVSLSFLFFIATCYGLFVYSDNPSSVEFILCLIGDLVWVYYFLCYFNYARPKIKITNDYFLYRKDSTKNWEKWHKFAIADILEAKLYTHDISFYDYNKKLIGSIGLKKFAQDKIHILINTLSELGINVSISHDAELKEFEYRQTHENEIKQKTISLAPINQEPVTQNTTCQMDKEDISQAISFILVVIFVVGCYIYSHTIGYDCREEKTNVRRCFGEISSFIYHKQKAAEKQNECKKEAIAWQDHCIGPEEKEELKIRDGEYSDMFWAINN